MAEPYKKLFRLITTISDPGDSKYREDGLKVTEVPGAVFAIALNGVSGLYTGSPILLDGLSGGEAAARTVEEAFAYPRFTTPLYSALVDANNAVRFKVANRFPDDNAVKPGATFAAAKITTESITIITGGDCVAAWQYGDPGKVGASHNQVRAHDRVLDAGHTETMREVLAELLANKNGGFFSALPRYFPGKGGFTSHLLDRAYEGTLALEELPEELVEKFIRPGMRKKEFSLDGPVAKARRRDVNNTQVSEGYALLNGDRNLANCWQELDLQRENLKRLILCSDGLITRDIYMGKDEDAARFLFEQYERGGLTSIRSAVEAWEDNNSATSYTSRTERVGIAIEF